MEVFGFLYAEICNLFESDSARGGKRAAKPDGQVVALVEEALRQGDGYANNFEGELLVEHNPETRKELALFIDESHQWLAHLRGLVPHQPQNQAATQSQEVRW